MLYALLGTEYQTMIVLSIIIVTMIYYDSLSETHQVHLIFSDVKKL